MVRLLYVLGGLVFLAMAVLTGVAPKRDERRERDRGVPVAARVTAVEHVAEDGSPFHQLVLEFDAGTSGRAVATVAVPDWMAEQMTSGRTIAIRYDATNPTQVWLPGQDRSPSVLGVLFLLVIAAAFFSGAVWGAD